MTTNAKVKKPIEKKVKVGALATYFGSVAMLGVIGAVNDNPILISGLPDLLEALLLSALPTLVTFFAAYKAKHTPRPDLKTEDEVDPTIRRVTPTYRPPTL